MEMSKTNFVALAAGMFEIESFEDLIYIGKENLLSLSQFWDTQEKMLAVRSNALYREFEDVRQTKDRERAELANETRLLVNKKKHEINGYKGVIWNAVHQAVSKPFLPDLRPFTYLKVGDEVVLKRAVEDKFSTGQRCGLYPAYSFSRSFVVEDRKTKLTVGNKGAETYGWAELVVSVKIDGEWLAMTSPELFRKAEYDYFLENEDFLKFVLRGWK